MFTTDVTLAGDASSTRTYALTSIAGGQSVRANASVAVGEAEVMTISHGRKTKAPDSPERHLVRLDLTKVSALGVPATGSVYVVIEEPQATVTPAQIQDMATQLKNFLTAGNITKLLNGEP